MTKKEFTEKLIEKHGKLNIQTSVRKEHVLFEYEDWRCQTITVTKFFVGAFIHGKGFLKSPVHCGTWSVLGCSFDSDGSKF